MQCARRGNCPGTGKPSFHQWFQVSKMAAKVDSWLALWLRNFEKAAHGTLVTGGVCKWSALVPLLTMHPQPAGRADLEPMHTPNKSKQQHYMYIQPPRQNHSVLRAKTAYLGGQQPVHHLVLRCRCRLVAVECIKVDLPNVPSGLTCRGAGCISTPHAHSSTATRGRTSAAARRI
jgi:hypothetical protein